MKSLRLSVTWQVRLVNAALSALILVALVLLAQARIRAVLFGAFDKTLTELARDVAERPHPDARPFGGEGEPREPMMPPQEGFGGGRPPRPGGFRDGGRQAMMPPGEGFGGRGGGGFDRPPFGQGMPRRERRIDDPPPQSRFGADALLPYRLLAFDNNPAPPPYSVSGRDAAVATGFDKRVETTADKKRLRVISVKIDANGQHPLMVVQAAGYVEPLDTTLREIDAALYTLLLPLAVLASVGGAFLTEMTLAPVRRLAQAVASIQSSNLSARLPEPGGGDAFDTLAVRLNALLARLDAAFARQKRFTGAASHELRTPLAVIKSATSLLLENPQSLSPLQKRTLDRADQSSDRANRLITDLLTLTRTENGSLPVLKSVVPIAPFLRDVAADFPNSVVPVVVTAPEMVTVTTDADMVRRLLQNLVGNALRHTAHGQVTISAGVMRGVFTLTVSDTGEGIPPDVLPRLGEPFYRPDSSRARDTGGAGLGISLCREIIAALGGTLQYASTPGQGTTVTATIPNSDILRV